MKLTSELSSQLDELSNLQLAQLLAQRVAINNRDWHKLKNDRQAQALQQLTSGLVYLLNEQTEEALQRINQAQGWLDKSIKPLPCPTHGQKKNL